MAKPIAEAKARLIFEAVSQGISRPTVARTFHVSLETVKLIATGEWFRKARERANRAKRPKTSRCPKCGKKIRMPCRYCAMMLRAGRSQWPEKSLGVAVERLEGGEEVCRIVKLSDEMVLNLRGDDAKRYKKLVKKRLALINSSQEGERDGNDLRRSDGE